MALLGKGLIAIWNDIAWSGRDNFYRWHDHEHMEERVGIEGFLRGRRFVRHGSAEIEWLTLYETRGPDVLAGEAYLARLNDPTPWTQETIPTFRNVTRALCEVKTSRGASDGGLALASAYMVEPRERAAAINCVVDWIGETASAAGICAAHLSVTDKDASAVVTAEKRARGNTDLSPDLVVLIEASRTDALDRASTGLGEVLGGIAGVECLRAPGIYRLETQLEKRG